jgi:hypothetical protein
MDVLPNFLCPDKGTYKGQEIEPNRILRETMSHKPSVTLTSTVEKIIKSPISGEPEKAEIVVEGGDHLYREIRIGNTLEKEHGER